MNFDAPVRGRTINGIWVPDGLEEKSDRTQSGAMATASNRGVLDGASGAESRFADVQSYLEAVKTVPWVYACVSLLAYSFATAPGDLIDTTKGAQGEPVEDPHDPFLQVWGRPNPHQSAMVFKELLDMFISLAGEAFISLEEKDSDGRPTELYLPSPARMRVVQDKRTGDVVGYAYDTSGYQNGRYLPAFIPYAVDEIVHIKVANPLNMLRGLGNIEAMEVTMDTMIAMNRNELSYWQSGGRITGVLETDQQVDNETFDRLVNRWRQFTADKKQRFKTAILEQGLKYTPVAEGFKGLDYSKLDTAKRDFVLANFGVPKNKLGIIEDAAYKSDEADRFFWCFPAGTLVTTRNGEMAIENVRPGIDVLTHRGRWRSVSEARSRDYDGTMVTLDVARHERPVRATAEHPFLTQRGWVEAINLREGDFLLGSIVAAGERVVREVETRRSGRLELRNVEITPHGARLIGLFLAEGHIVRRGGAVSRVDLTFGADETDLIGEAAELLSAFGPARVARAVRGAVVVSGNVSAAKYLAQFGENAKTKFMPDWLLEAPAPVLAACVAAYFEGDGTVERYRLRATTVSRELAHGMRLALTALGIIPGLAVRSAGTKVLAGRAVNVSESWKIDITGGDARIGRQIMGLPEVEFDPRGSSDRGATKFIDGLPAYRVRGVAHDHEGLRVYNIEVDEDHSYLAEGLVAHNSETMEPRLTRFEDAIQPLVDIFGTDRVWRFERKNYEDDTVKLNNAMVMQSLKSFTRDEIRAYIGVPEIGGKSGKIVILQQTDVPVAIDSIDEASATGVAGGGPPPTKPPDSTPKLPGGHGGGHATGHPPIPGVQASANGNQNGRSNSVDDSGHLPNKPATLPQPPEGKWTEETLGQLHEEERDALRQDYERQLKAAALVERNMRARGRSVKATGLRRVVEYANKAAVGTNALPAPAIAHPDKPGTAALITGAAKRTRESLTTKFVPKIRAALTAQRRALTPILSKVLKITDPAERRKVLSESFPRDAGPSRVIAALHAEAANEGWRTGKRSLGFVPKTAADFEMKATALGYEPLVNPLLADRYEEILGPHITEIDSFTEQQVMDVIDEGIRRGYSPLQIANGDPRDQFLGLDAIFDDAYRAEMIARTESMFAYNWGQGNSLIDSGATEEEAMDGSGDPECAARNGEVYSIDPNTGLAVDDSGEPVRDHPNGTLAFIPTGDLSDLLPTGALEELGLAHWEQKRAARLGVSHKAADTTSPTLNANSSIEGKLAALHEIGDRLVALVAKDVKYSPDQPRDNHGRFGSGDGEFDSPRGGWGPMVPDSAGKRIAPGDVVVTGEGHHGTVMSVQHDGERGNHRAMVQFPNHVNQTHPAGIYALYSRTLSKVDVPVESLPAAHGGWTTSSAGAQESKAEGLKYSDEEPRDDHGRWTSGGGGSGEDKPIKVKTIDEAIALLGDGKGIMFERPDQAVTLLHELAKIANEAKAAGKKAKTYDLCKVSVENTNLFCAENVGIPRSAMPQLVGKPLPGTPADAMEKNAKGEVDLSQAFRDSLIASGHTILDTQDFASHLRASQNQMDGTKVGGMMEAMLAGKVAPAAIFVSDDNYIVDGHHRFAATVGVGLGDHKEMSMPIARVDMKILPLLKAANDFSVSMGIPQAGVDKGAWYLESKYAQGEGFKYSPDQPRDDHGRFGAGSADGGGILDAAGLRSAAKTAAALLKSTDGFTFNAQNGKFTKIGDPGFGVSPFKGHESPPFAKPPTAREIFDYASAPERHALLSEPGNNVGGWKNDNGTYVLDVSIVTASGDEAHQIARDNNQDAVFNFATGESEPTRPA